jgi:hypothetical protein
VRSSHRQGISGGHGLRGQAARQLRADELTRAMPIIVLTGQGRPS